jgi:4-amino-4-deoxy-L-arabinose transferase-like glycosyltransferase
MATAASSAPFGWQSLTRAIETVFPLPLVLRLGLWGAAVVAGLMGHLQLSFAPVPDNDPVLRHIPIVGDDLVVTSLSRGLAYMAAATLFVILAAWDPSREEHREVEAAASSAPLWQRLRPHALPLALLLIAIGLGVAFRVYLLDSQPFGIWFDEAQNGLIADRMVHEDAYRPVFISEYTGTNRPALPVYVFAVGVQFIGREILALRSVSAVAGILTIVPLFLLARELFGWRIAAMAAFFLAVMRWHLNFSRLAMEPIWGPFFTVTAIYFLVRGVKNGRWYEFAASGLFLGLGLYFYWAFLLVPLVYAAYTLHSYLAKRSAQLLPLAAGAVIVAVVGFLVYSPVAVYGYQHPDRYQARANQVTITKDKDFGETVAAVKRTTRLHVLMFNSQGDANGRHNLSAAPMLDKFTGVFFVLGVGLALARAWQPRYFLLLAWLVILLQPAIWSVEFEAPQALRAILVTPAVAMLAALPLGALWDMAGQRRIRAPDAADMRPEGGVRGRLLASGRYAAGGAVGLALLFFLAQTAYHNFNTYFNVQLNHSRTWTEFNSDVTFVGKEMDRLGASHRFIVSTLFSSPVIQFVYPDAGDGSVFAFNPPLDLPLRESRPTAIFLDQTKRPFFEWLRELYPNMEVREARPPGEGQPAVVYEVIVSPEEIDRLRGVDATYRSEGGEVVTRREPAIEFAWDGSPAPLAFPFEAAWSGQLVIGQYGVHEIALEAPGPIVLRLDGEVVAEGRERVFVTHTFYRGRHELEIEATVEEAGRVVLTDNGEPFGENAYLAPAPAGSGLLATFYGGTSWEGDPLLEQLDPFVGMRYHAELPFGSPFSVIWRGRLDVPASAVYPLQVQANGIVHVLIDGEERLSTAGTLAADVRLDAGLHDIEVRFANEGGFAEIYLSWTPPNADMHVIPTRFLYPR